ncbi:hypothetical protein X798_02652 [Onchocerca flexuosa]|uniref:Uncharacterized protein n=1 Tax=Onchocerca flexuosa TaxID=387005 RepID=A0A238BZT7_9BILA|nr:hypothetical protein X798_02652 [Onchocerca flexuosa]
MELRLPSRQIDSAKVKIYGILIMNPNWTHVFWGACFWCYPVYVLANLHRVEVIKYDIYGNLIQDKAVAEYWWRYPSKKNARQ